MRTVSRVAALIVGLIGTFDGIVINVVVSLYHEANRLLGGTVPSHGVIGSVLLLVAFIGAVLALRQPIPAGILLLLAGIGFFFVVHLWALLASPQMIVAGALALTSGTEQEHAGGTALRPRGEPTSAT